MCICAALGTYQLRDHSATMFGGFHMGFETLILSGVLTFAGLWIVANGVQVRST